MHLTEVQRNAGFEQQCLVANGGFHHLPRISSIFHRPSVMWARTCQVPFNCNGPLPKHSSIARTCHLVFRFSVLCTEVL